MARPKKQGELMTQSKLYFSESQKNKLQLFCAKYGLTISQLVQTIANVADDDLAEFLGLEEVARDKQVTVHSRAMARAETRGMTRQEADMCRELNSTVQSEFLFKNLEGD